MKQAMADVAEFHRKVGAPVLDRPEWVPAPRIELRQRLCHEEAAELDMALDALLSVVEDHETSRACLEAIAKELGDVMVVCCGTALELGIPLDRVWDEVHRSNMTKSADHTRGDGKILKGPNYQPPDIAKALWGRALDAVSEQPEQGEKP